MIRWIHRVSTLLVFAIGIIHVLYTFIAYRSLSESAIWFSGAGLAGIFVALLNVALWRPDVHLLARRSVAVANFLFFFWLVAGVSAMPGAAPVVVGGVGAAMVITAPLLWRQKKSGTEA